MLDKLRTISLVTFVTLLVWLYAEGAVVRTFNNQRVTVQFTSAADQPVLIEPDSVAVTLSFTGSTAQHQRLSEWRAGGGAVTVQLEPGPDPLQQIDLVDALRDGVLDEIGIVPDAVTPDVQMVTVQRMVRRRVPVRVRFDAADLRGDVRVTPPDVQVLMPEEQAVRLGSAGVEARLDLSLDAEPAEPGEETVRELPLVPPQQLLPHWETASATTAEVAFTLAEGNEEVVLSAVPLWVLAPPTLAFDVQVEGDAKTIGDVRVTGPRDVVRRLGSGGAQGEVWGEIRLVDATALAEGKRSVPVVFNLPEGVTAEPRSVIVTLARRGDPLRDLAPSPGGNGTPPTP